MGRITRIYLWLSKKNTDRNQTTDVSLILDVFSPLIACVLTYVPALLFQLYDTVAYRRYTRLFVSKDFVVAEGFTFACVKRTGEDNCAKHLLSFLRLTELEMRTVNEGSPLFRSSEIYVAVHVFFSRHSVTSD